MIGFLKKIFFKSVGMTGVFFFVRFIKANSEQSRSVIVKYIGNSGNRFAPMILIKLLDDPCYEIRKKAVENLGELKASSALYPLIREIESKNSDIKKESAEALGKIGKKEAADALLRLYESGDPDIKITAVISLGRIGGDEIKKRLFDIFAGDCPDYLFSVFADTMSRLGVIESVEIIMSRLKDFKENPQRLELLNSICRVLGAGNEFYSLISKDEYARISRLYELILHTQKNVRKSPVFSEKAVATSINGILVRLVRTYRNENQEEFLSSIWEIMAYIQLVLPELPYGESIPVRPYIGTVNKYLNLKNTEDVKSEGMIFLVIALDILIEKITEEKPR